MILISPSATAETQVGRVGECLRLAFSHPESGVYRAATCRSDRSRTCSPANARLECDPAWGHGHVLGEGQRTSPYHYIATECVDIRMCAISNSWRRYVTLSWDIVSGEGGRIPAARKFKQRRAPNVKA